MVTMRRKITKYILKGPQAVEQRLGELEKKLTLARQRLQKVVALQVRYVTKGTGGLLERGVKRVVGTLMNTIHEIDQERKDLQSFLGSSLRVWETKKSDPAPFV